MKKSLIAFIASLAMIATLGAGSAAQAAALTATQISAIVSLLQSFGADATTVANVTASLNGQATTGTASTATTVTASGYTFAKDLTVGAKGADVTALQNFLGVTPATGYFGSLTKAALIKYQLSKGITPAAGYFGAKTRAVVNGSGSTTGSTGTTVVATGTDLSVSIAATSPSGSALIQGQAAANLAEYTFTNRSAAPAVVTNVTLQRGGVSADTSLDSVYLFNGATRLTDAATVSSGKITFNAASGLFTVPAGSSITIAVKADIATTAVSGQIISVSLTGTTASIPVAAVYPIVGASMTVAGASDLAALTLGTVSNPIASNNTTSIQAGVLNQTIWQSALTITQRAVYLKSMALKVIGSIPTNSLQNVKLFVGGVQVASATGMDANSMITFDLTAAPYKIDSSRTLEVRADIVNGSSRSFSVSLQNKADLQVYDSNYNIGIASAGIPASTGNINISTGSVVITQDSTLSAGNIVTGSSNVPVARYTFKAYGEDMKISYLYASSTKDLDNVALYANGVQIGSTQTVSSTTPKLYNLGSSLIIPAGSSVTVEVRADIKYNGTNLSTSNTSVIVALGGYPNNAQGSYSQTLSTIPASYKEGVTMTVVGAGLTSGKNASVSDTTGVPNTSNVRIGSYTLQANSSEAIRITSLTVGIASTGSISATTSLSNLYVKVDGVATTPVASQVSNNFSVDFTIPANGSKVVDIYADLGTDQGAASTTLAVYGYGVSSNVTVSQTNIVGQKITVGSGTLAVPTVDSNTSPVAQFVVGGTTSKVVDYNFVSSNGASTIQEMYFDVTGKIVSVTVGGQTATVNSTNGSTTVTGLNINIPVGYAGANVPVTATYATIGQNGEASMKDTYVKLSGYKYTSGNNTVSTTTLAASNLKSNTMKVVASKPTVAIAKAGTTSLGTGDLGSVVIAKITITPDSAGPIGLMSLPLRISTSAGATSTGSIIVKVSGTQIATTSFGTISPSSATTSSIVFSGTNGYQISGATTFDIYAPVEFSSNTDLSPAITTGIASTGFVWSDINGGGSTEGATSTDDLIVNFPTDTVQVRGY